MEALGYPNPDGSYVVYLLGDELLSEPLDIRKLMLKTLPNENVNVPFSPAILKGKDIANMVDKKTIQQRLLQEISLKLKQKAFLIATSSVPVSLVRRSVLQGNAKALQTPEGQCSSRLNAYCVTRSQRDSFSKMLKVS